MNETESKYPYSSLLTKNLSNEGVIIDPNLSSNKDLILHGLSLDEPLIERLNRITTFTLPSLNRRFNFDGGIYDGVPESPKWIVERFVEEFKDQLPTDFSESLVARRCYIELDMLHRIWLKEEQAERPYESLSEEMALRIKTYEEICKATHHYQADLLEIVDVVDNPVTGINRSAIQINLHPDYVAMSRQAITDSEVEEDLLSGEEVDKVLVDYAVEMDKLLRGRGLPPSIYPLTVTGLAEAFRAEISLL